MISTHSLPTEQHGRQENLCWYALRGDPCPYGTKCKFPHIASVHIDGIIQTMVNEGTVLTVKESSRIKKGLIWKLSLTFRKTRLCFKFARNICLYDEDCIFVHAKGPDARTILGKRLSNQSRKTSLET